MANDDQLIEEFRKFIDSQKTSPTLSNVEIDHVRRMIAAFEILESMGRVGKFALWAVTALAAFLIAWGQIVEKVAGK